MFLRIDWRESEARALKVEREGRDGLKAVSDRWDDVGEFLR